MPAVAEHSTTADRSGSAVVDIDVVIVGAGFSGLGMACNLKQAGYDDFVVLEKADEVGGTWRENTYPNCACDVPSNLYSFSFAPKADWPHTYSRQPAIQQYLRDTADLFGLREHTRFGCEFLDAGWDDETMAWEVQTSDGPVCARVLVAAMGPLHIPSVPDLPGIEQFEGTAFHSAEWNHDHDFQGRTVAVIGTGASAIQFVPGIQPEAEQLHVFQRTAPWVMPHPSRKTSSLERTVFGAAPQLQRLVRGAIYAGRETFVVGFVKQPVAMKLAERIARRHMDSQISDPQLRQKVEPDYPFGCKRVLPSNDWYPALDSLNVELVTDGIREVTAAGVVTEDGTEREVDTIIWGTGFKVTDLPVTRQVRGRDGRLLADHWGPSMRAHLGATVPGFPNFFLVLGPNTGLGHSSMVYMAESQIAYVMDALRLMRERGRRAVEVRPEVEERYNEQIDERMQGTIWNSGCASWYLDDTGRNSTLWPDWTWRFRQRTAEFDPAEHELRGELDAGADRPTVAA